jgi:hypothetical protein
LKKAGAAVTKNKKALLAQRFPYAIFHIELTPFEDHGLKFGGREN